MSYNTNLGFSVLIFSRLLMARAIEVINTRLSRVHAVFGNMKKIAEDNMLFSGVKMLYFRLKADLVFHWCLLNKINFRFRKNRNR